jgi:hypothetical protein
VHFVKNAFGAKVILHEMKKQEHLEILQSECPVSQPGLLAGCQLGK